jgi:hypothetical protein
MANRPKEEEMQRNLPSTASASVENVSIRRKRPKKVDGKEEKQEHIFGCCHPSVSVVLLARYFTISLQMALNTLNLVLMLVALLALLIWSWNGQPVGNGVKGKEICHKLSIQLGVGVNLLFLCAHSLLWLNSFVFNRQLLYQVFLISYVCESAFKQHYIPSYFQAILLVLCAFHLFIFSIIFLANGEGSRKMHFQQVELSMDGHGQGMPAAAVFVLILVGMLVIVLGIMLEFAVCKRCRKLRIENEDRAKIEEEPRSVHV